jgi:hypothetical protein
VLRDLSLTRKLELMSTFLEAYGATQTRSQVDVFLRGLLPLHHEGVDSTRTLRGITPETSSHPRTDPFRR